jgi:hypothetical protein
MIRFTDEQIAILVSEVKQLPLGYRSELLNNMRQEDKHKRSFLKVTGVNGTMYTIHLRQNIINPLNFSAILIHSVPNTSIEFRLRRYNGRSHRHTNKIEANAFYDFHIHFATERYQSQNLAEDEYAEVTDRYSDIEGALKCMVHDCGFIIPPGEPLPLF